MSQELMSSLLATIGTILIVEIFYQFRRSFQNVRINMVTLLKQSVKIIYSKKINDKSKEKLLKRYVVNLFVLVLTLSSLMLLTVSPFGIIVIVDSLNGGTLLQFLQTVGGLLLSTLVAIIYAVIRMWVFNV